MPAIQKPFAVPAVFSALALSAAFAAPAAFAGTPERDVYPKPQEIKILRAVPVPAEELAPSVAEAFPAVAEALRARGVVPAGTLAVSAKIDPAAEGLRRVPGAYVLSVEPGGIAITAFDAAGVFYASQTLAQMIAADGSVQPCVVVDYPDVPFRGSVEGFYGKPWAHESRLAQLRFYGKNKLNAYVYGPKDDPYSGFNSPLWREPYPAEQAKQISELVATARENHVAFYWALHPGADIRWDDADGNGVPDDVEAALKKLEAMYALGVRAFAVFFDDVSGDGTNIEKQAEMMNFLNREFARKKGDVAPLMMCPTEYAGTRPSNYKRRIGEALDADIFIMWTGPEVCSDIPAPDVDGITAFWKRPPFIWWNWPVSDYCRANLLLGRTYGLDKANKGKLSGFVSNPMDKPEASKIALFGVADWTWNIDAFDSEKSWADSFAKLYPSPEVAVAMHVFARHNSDQGKYSQYRREESVEFRPTAAAALAEYSTTGTINEAGRRRVAQEFAAVSESARTLEAALPQSDPALWHEIEFWVKSFGELGKIGTAALALATAPELTGDERLAAFSAIVSAKARQQEFFAAQKKRHFEETVESDKKSASGCRVGTRVLTPFADDLTAGEWKRFREKLGAECAAAPADVPYKAFTNVPALAGKTAADRHGIYVKLRRVPELVTLEPGQFLGLALPEGVPAAYVHMKLDNPRAAQLCAVEISKDGTAWERLEMKILGGEIWNELNPRDGIRFFRLVNVSDEATAFHVGLFKFDVPAWARPVGREAVFDGDIASFFLTTETATFDVPADREALVLADAEKIEREPGKITVHASPERPARIFEMILR